MPEQPMHRAVRQLPHLTCAALLLTALTCGAALAAPTTQPSSAAAPATRPSADAKVSPFEQLQFQQKNAQAQMQELEERMYRLAELTRQSEPDDSARLILAVKK